MPRPRIASRVPKRRVEPECTPIQLPFTRESLAMLLRAGAAESRSDYTHEQIADWCLRCSLHFMHVFDDQRDLTTEEQLIDDIAQDVDAQWELYLVNTYTYEQLLELALSSVRLPREWFARWLSRLD